ncbi:uncharacterized protein LOC142329270 [Lycorma delicatula]|uniref:uncharacterized protein LOC142329270 n=1 Tax=Lycorma delicatula TaxID=130591 RepID=UPI003F50F1CC
MAYKSLFVSCAVLLVVVMAVNAEPEPEAKPGYIKPVTRVVHVHGEPVSRYVYTRHIHYHEPAPHAHVVKYYAPPAPHVREEIVDYHYDPHYHAYYH